MRSCICLLWMFIMPWMAMANGMKLNDICEGDSLPLFTVKSDHGKTFVSPPTTGRPMVIVFFNTHCWNCRQELPLVQEMYEKYGDEVDFITISRAEPQAEVAAYWQEQGFTLPYAAQEDRRIFQLFAEKMIPRIYIADAGGVVRKVFVEKVRKRALRRHLLQILEKK